MAFAVALVAILCAWLVCRSYLHASVDVDASIVYAFFLGLTLGVLACAVG